MHFLTALKGVAVCMYMCTYLLSCSVHNRSRAAENALLQKSHELKQVLHIYSRILTCMMYICNADVKH